MFNESTTHHFLGLNINTNLFFNIFSFNISRCYICLHFYLINICTSVYYMHLIWNFYVNLLSY